MVGGAQTLIAALMSTAMVVIVVIVHHECLTYISKGFLARIKTPKRLHVGISAIMVTAAHVLEILFCAALLYLACEVLRIGSVEGDVTTDITTYIYYSFASYTSLGIGDLYPSGHLRLLTGMEALLGLLMIGWTASFLLLEMRQFWSTNNPNQ